MTDPLPLQTRSTRSSSRKLEQAKAYAALQSLPQQRRSVRVVQLQSIKDSKIQKEIVARETVVNPRKKKVQATNKTNKRSCVDKRKTSQGSSSLSTSAKIGTLTLSQIKSKSKNFSLFHIASPKIRQEVYSKIENILQSIESLQLPEHNGRTWSVSVRIKEIDRQKTHRKKGPLFRWFKNRLEYACTPYLVDQIPQSEYYTGEDESGSGNSSSVNDVIGHSTLSETAYELENFRSTLQVITSWTSPMKEIFRTRKSAMERVKELHSNDVFIDKIIYGVGVKDRLLMPRNPSLSQSITAGYYRFVRDGIWVVNQELGWQEANKHEMMRRAALGLCISTGDAPIATYCSPAEEFVRSQRSAYRAKLGVGKNVKVDADLRKIWRSMDCNDRDVWRKDKTKYVLQLPSDFDTLFIEKKKKIPVVSDVSSQESESQHQQQQEQKVSPSTVTPPLETFSVPSVPKVIPQCQPKEPSFTTSISNQANTKGCVSNDLSEHKKCKKRSRVVDRADQKCKIFDPDSDVWFTATCIRHNQETGEYCMQYNRECTESMFISENIVDKQPKDSNGSLKRRKVIWDADLGTIGVNRKKWNLPQEHIYPLYELVLDHYHKCLHTIQARGLQNEFHNNGFDYIRERGRLRYDLEIPELDEYTYLNNETAPWMEIVNKVLGCCTDGTDTNKNESQRSKLVHKGAFLSLPGSEAQVYHQDGLHINNRTHKPAYAVNVFIPLVDLTLKNGPTEFCLGTHVLGAEDYDRNFIDVPCVTAGTPIIFDYRVGHRGLANISTDPRPYIYLTYSLTSISKMQSSILSQGTTEAMTITDKKEVLTGTNWKDAVNFSRKRFKNLGDLIDLPQSREERQKKRLKKKETELEEKEISMAIQSVMENKISKPFPCQEHSCEVGINGYAGTNKHQT